MGKKRNIKEINDRTDNNETTTTTTIKNWEDINIEDLKNQSFNEIKEIAINIGISINSESCNRLIDKITFIVENNRETKDNQIKNDNINPFNKDSKLSSLIISNDQQGRNELLFWKIFKNKTIYKNIMKHVRLYGSHSISYDNYISVSKMISNNQFSILKDKVNRNKYLSFSEVNYNSDNYFYYHYNHKGRECDKNLKIVWVKLFKSSILNEDYEFYNNLFKNYKNQIPFKNSNPDDDNDRLSYIVKKLIKYNHTVLNFLINIGKFYKPTIQDLQYAIKKSNLESLKLLLSSSIDNDEIIKGSMETILDYKAYYPNFSKIHTKDTNIIDSTSCIELLFKSVFTSSNNQSSGDDSVGCTRGGCGNDYILGFYKSIENLEPINLKLKEVIALITLLDLCDAGNSSGSNDGDILDMVKFSDSQRTTIDYIKKEKQQDLINELNYQHGDYKSFQFSDQQLESKLNDPINYKSNEKDNIKKLLNFFFKISFQESEGNGNGDLQVNFKDSFFEFYMAYYSFDAFDWEYHNCNHETPIQIYKLSLEYSNYKSFKSSLIEAQKKEDNQVGLRLRVTYQNSGGHSFGINSLENFVRSSGLYNKDGSTILFSKCGIDGGSLMKAHQIEFLNLLIQDLKSDSFDTRHKLSSLTLFKMLIEYNNLELIKHFVTQIGGKHRVFHYSNINIETNISYNHIYSITYYIKSVEIMEYLYNEFNNLICSPNLSIFIIDQHQQQQQQQTNNNNNNQGSIRCQISDLKLLKKLESLVKQKQPLLIDIKNPTIELFQYVVNNSSCYDISKIINQKPIDFNYSINNKSIYYSSLKNLILTSPQANLKIKPFCFDLRELTEYPSIEFINFYNWYNNYSKKNGGESVIITNIPSSPNAPYSTWLSSIFPTVSGFSTFSSTSFSASSMLKLLEYFSICDDDTDDTDDKLFKDVSSYTDILYNFINISHYATIRGDLKTLHRILNILLSEYESNQDSKIREFISNILISAISNECLFILEYLLFKYPIIFKKKFELKSHQKKKSKKNKKNKNNNNDDDEDDEIGGFFNQGEISTLVIESLKRFNPQITEFLFSLFTVTKIQFNQNSNISSLYYFNAKF